MTWEEFCRTYGSVDNKVVDIHLDDKNHFKYFKDGHIEGSDGTVINMFNESYGQKITPTMMDMAIKSLVKADSNNYKTPSWDNLFSLKSLDVNDYYEKHHMDLFKELAPLPRKERRELLLKLYESYPNLYEKDRQMIKTLFGISLS